MIITTVKCDGCGKEKGETNHWFSIQIREAGDRHFNDRDEYPNLRIIRFSMYPSDQLHLCGEACVTKKVSEFLATLKLKKFRC